MDQADPLIAPGHVIHWKISSATYDQNRPEQIDGWLKVGETWDSAMYYNEKRCILGFKGTQMLFNDFYNDIQLTLNQKGCPPKADPTAKMVQDFFNEGHGIPLQLTGHSLGGAVARCVGNLLNLNVVTFNAAAPPNGIVQTQPSPRETNYHIFGDIISAWECPNTIRIDKGFNLINGPDAFNHSVKQFQNAHTLAAFSAAGKPGTIVSASTENDLFDRWYQSTPQIVKSLWGSYADFSQTIKTASSSVSGFVKSVAKPGPVSKILGTDLPRLY